MEIALRLMRIGAGDEVITTPMTWVATTNIIINAGATPVLVDIDPATRNIDLDKLEAAITPRTKAILPVDLAGLPVDRDRLYAIAHKHGLRVLEDAAQSQGATWQGQRVGSFGDLCSISFHPNKNMTTTEGGALVMNNEEEAREFEKWRLQGVTRFADGTMDCDLPGGKYNMTDVSAPSAWVSSSIWMPSMPAAKHWPTCTSPRSTATWGWSCRCNRPIATGICSSRCCRWRR